MEADQKQQIIERNEKIRDGILVSQMKEHKGFAILKKYLEKKKEEIRFQDILGIHDLETLYTQQGIAVCIEDIDSFFEEAENWAEQPMQDPDTGVYEKMKKEE